jgi:hypothetical protein
VFEDRDEIPEKIKFSKLSVEAIEALLVEPVPDKAREQWLRIGRLLKAFSVVDDRFGKMAKRMLETYRA